MAIRALSCTTLLRVSGEMSNAKYGPLSPDWRPMLNSLELAFRQASAAAAGRFSRMRQNVRSFFSRDDSGALSSTLKKCPLRSLWAVRTRAFSVILSTRARRSLRDSTSRSTFRKSGFIRWRLTRLGFARVALRALSGRDYSFSDSCLISAVCFSQRAARSWTLSGFSAARFLVSVRFLLRS